MVKVTDERLGQLSESQISQPILLPDELSKILCCCKGDIQVEGREATEAQSTCCGSFKDRGTNGAACNALKDVSKEIDVACEATHCRFNENEKCHADVRTATCRKKQAVAKVTRIE